MKDLEKYIRDRKEEFDFAEPEDGHFERFMKNIPGMKRSGKGAYILKIAAILVAAALIPVAVYVFQSIDKNKSLMDSMSEEVKETLYYYQTVNLEKENQILTMPVDDKTEINRIRYDIKNYDKEYKQLINDLRNFPNDQRVINAIIEYHRSKSEMLEQIIYQLNKHDV